jgi:hypothetical protein
MPGFLGALLGWNQNSHHPKTKQSCVPSSPPPHIITSWIQGIASLSFQLKWK